MIGKALGHYQGTSGYLVLSRIACLFLTSTALSWPVDPLTISAPVLAAADSAATLTVTKLADTNDGACDADCSLREALAAAAPDDTVGFASGLTGTIKLGNTLAITKNVTINGPSTKAITISGNNAVRVFYVNLGVQFTIKNLTVANGSIKGAHGSNGELCESGRAGGIAQGGGLYNGRGIVTISNSTFSGNRAVGGVGGTGRGSAVMTCAWLIGGRGGEGKGGALYNNEGIVTIVNSTFSGNQAIGGTGGRGDQGGLAGGPGGNGLGGGMYSTGTVFSVNSTFSDNRAKGGAAGQSPSGVAAGAPGGDGLGGALYAMAAVSLTNDTISSNSANGGAGGSSGVLNGITLFSGGDGGSGYGGAIYCSYDTRVSNCTFANNAASAGVPGLNFKVNSAAVGSGGAIYRPGVLPGKNILAVNRSGAINIRNTLIADSSSGGNCEALIISGGYNIDTDGTCALTAVGDLLKTNPKLGPLKNNGGLTFTHALLPGSPAIDTGNLTGCTDHDGIAILTDQRERPRMGRCDIGAFEFSR